MKNTTIHMAAALATVLQLGACGAGDDAGTADAFSARCSQDTRADTYVPGLEKTGAAVTMVLLESTPGPPAKGDNRWLLLVKDSAGLPLSDLAMTVTPFMPDHGHGTSIKTVVTTGANPGEYVVDPINLWMPGYWEVTVRVTDGASIDDSVIFGPCIEG